VKRKPLPILAFLNADVVGRFRSKVRTAGPDECWPWKGETNNHGYGRFTIYLNNRRIRLFAHRVAFALAGSEEIGDKVLLHQCDNPPCCNPRHLRCGTQADNLRDALVKGRMDLSGLDLGRRPRRTQCRNGHPYSDANISLWNGSRRCLTCKREGQKRYDLRKASKRPLKDLGPDGRVTHCRNGHPYDEANTYIRTNGSKKCRACNREITRLAAAKRGETREALARAVSAA
jgi:hypothetical protein